MKRHTRQALAMAVALAATASGAVAQTPTLESTIAGGRVSGQLNLRYEGVSEDNALEDAKALTLRTALKYTTATLNGFSAVLEVEDVSAVGLDDYSVPPSGFNTGQYSVIADPETTEINQAYLQYANGGFMARVGRQDIRYDNQRFIGAVPWRQDYQSFDALTLQYKSNTGKPWTANYHYLTSRERIFAQDADIKSKDHLLHGVIATPIGSLTGYAWLLEEEIAINNSLDTVGLRLTGSRKINEKYNATYLAEFAWQDYERGAASHDTRYFLLEGGLTVQGITAKLGIESLGSDGGAYGFATPLATLHAFQGWADQFLATPNQGIDDVYFSLGRSVAGGTLSFIYHDYSAEHETPAVKDLGREYNLQWIRPFRNNYQFGLKYANYQQGDLAAKADKQIIWTWMQLNF